MGIRYREDDDLAFLKYCDEEDIEQLATFIIYNKDGDERITSEILRSKEFKALEGRPDKWRQSWQLVAGELQHFGGDSFANLVRRKGVLYREILTDVCKFFAVRFGKQASTYEKEGLLLEYLIKTAFSEISESERSEALQNLELPGASDFDVDDIIAALNGEASEIRAVSKWVARSVGAAFISPSLRRVTGTAIVGFAAPRLFLSPYLIAPITLKAISGEAYRVTIPATIQIAYMRRKYERRDRF